MSEYRSKMVCQQHFIMTFFCHICITTTWPGQIVSWAWLCSLCLILTGIHYVGIHIMLILTTPYHRLTILSHVPPSCDQCHAPVHFDIGIRVSFNYICYHRGLYTELLYAMVFSLGYWSGLVIPQFSVGLVWEVSLPLPALQGSPQHLKYFSQKTVVLVGAHALICG